MRKPSQASVRMAIVFSSVRAVSKLKIKVIINPARLTDKKRD